MDDGADARSYFTVHGILTLNTRYHCLERRALAAVAVLRRSTIAWPRNARTWATMGPGRFRVSCGGPGSWPGNRRRVDHDPGCARLRTFPVSKGVMPTRSGTGQSLGDSWRRYPVGEAGDRAFRQCDGRCSGRYHLSRDGVHSRGAVNDGQLTAGRGGSQGVSSMAARTASSAVMPWAAAESR